MTYRCTFYDPDPCPHFPTETPDKDCQCFFEDKRKIGIRYRSLGCMLSHKEIRDHLVKV